MNETTKRQAVIAVENALKSVGAKSFEDGVNTAATGLEKLAAAMRSMQTPEKFMAVLDAAPPVSRREEIVFLMVLRYLPHIMRYGVQQLAKLVVADLPAPPGGRPEAFTAEQRNQVCDFISSLHRQGVYLDDAKQRAANRFDRSLRTIERVWAQRGKPWEPRVTFHDALQSLCEKNDET